MFFMSLPNFFLTMQSAYVSDARTHLKHILLRRTSSVRLENSESRHKSMFGRELPVFGTMLGIDARCWLRRRAILCFGLGFVVIGTDAVTHSAGGECWQAEMLCQGWMLRARPIRVNQTLIISSIRWMHCRRQIVSFRNRPVARENSQGVHFGHLLGCT